MTLAWLTWLTKYIDTVAHLQAITTTPPAHKWPDTLSLEATAPTHTYFTNKTHVQCKCKCMVSTYMCISTPPYAHTLSHTAVIPLLISIPLAVRSSPGWSSGEWRQAEPVHSAYCLRLAANLQGETQLHFPSNASAGLDWSCLAP